MRIQYRFCILLLLSLGFAACHVDVGIRDGVYRGEFTVVYPPPFDTTINAPARIDFFHGNYTSYGRQDNYPGYSRGNFSYTADSVTFQDSIYVTTDHDGFLHIVGTYAYTVDHKRLKLWYKFPNVNWSYTYDLERQ